MEEFTIRFLIIGPQAAIETDRLNDALRTATKLTAIVRDGKTSTGLCFDSSSSSKVAEAGRSRIDAVQVSLKNRFMGWSITVTFRERPRNRHGSLFCDRPRHISTGSTTAEETEKTDGRSCLCGFNPQGRCLFGILN